MLVWGDLNEPPKNGASFNKTLGYTEIEFKHNVFITGYDEDKFIVFDYWTPGFTWRYESLEYERIMSSIDFSNPETVQMIYAFRKNTGIPQKG